MCVSLRIYAYSLVCTKFDVFKETKEWCNSFAILSEKPPHWYFSDHLKIVFVELTKFHKVAIKDLLDLKEQWCYLINRSRYMTPSEMEELSRASKEMKMASEHLKTLSLDREFRFQEEMREKYLRDRIAEEEFSREEGLKEGVKKGVEKGLKEGIETVALNLLRRGIEHSVICEDTGLSREEVSQLEKQIGNTPE